MAKARGLWVTRLLSAVLLGIGLGFTMNNLALYNGAGDSGFNMNFGLSIAGLGVGVFATPIYGAVGRSKRFVAITILGSTLLGYSFGISINSVLIPEDRLLMQIACGVIEVLIAVPLVAAYRKARVDRLGHN